MINVGNTSSSSSDDYDFAGEVHDVIKFLGSIVQARFTIPCLKILFGV